MTCFSSESQQKHQQVTNGDDAGELIVNHTKSQSEKVDAGQRQETDQGTTQSDKTRRFIITFPLLLLFTYNHVICVKPLNHLHMCSC